MDFYATLEPSLGKEIADKLRASRSQKEMHGLYLNAAKLSPSRLLEAFPSLKPHPFVPNGFIYEEGECEPGKHLYHHLGGYYLLDPASMLPPYLLNPTPGERVLDLCAAPGGKTCLMAMMMGPSGVILSNDLSYSRSRITSQNVERLGLSNVVVTAGDFEKAKESYQGYFDAILLDAPCSGSAMFRKDIRLEEDWSLEKVNRLTKTQKELLEYAASMLVSGGRIVYSTCSFSYEEDEAIILDFLAAHPEFTARKPFDCSLLFSHSDLLQSYRALPCFFPGEGQFACLLVHQGGKQSHPNAKPGKIDAESQRVLSRFGLTDSSPTRLGDDLYVTPENIDIHGLSTLRKGLKVGSFVRDRFEVDHALAIAGKMPYIEVSEEQAKRYLTGEGFPLDAPDGEVSLRYLDFDLGYAKIVSGYAKNHYPKGLRRKF